MKNYIVTNCQVRERPNSLVHKVNKELLITRRVRIDGEEIRVGFSGKCGLINAVVSALCAENKELEVNLEHQNSFHAYFDRESRATKDAIDSFNSNVWKRIKAVFCGLNAGKVG